MNLQDWRVSRRAGHALRVACCAVLLLGGARPAAGGASHASAPFGLGDRHHCQRFAEDFVHVLQQRWHKLDTPRARGLAFVDEVNERLKGTRVPKVQFDVSKSTGLQGFFDPESWTVYLARVHLESPRLDDSAAAELADAIYHEARHAEQWLFALRWHFDEGLGLTMIKVPPRVMERARKKKHLPPGSTEARLAAQWHKTLFGEDREMHVAILETLATTRRHWEALQGAGGVTERARAWRSYQAAWSLYVALPDEADAFAVAAVVRAALMPLLARRRH